MSAATAPAICVGCGREDTQPCDGFYSWLRVDLAARVGVCSECPHQVELFDAGHRKLSTQARLEVDLREVFGHG